MFSFSSSAPASQTSTNAPAAPTSAASPSSPFGRPSATGGFEIPPPTAGAVQPSLFDGCVLRPAAIPSAPSVAAPLSPFGGFGNSGFGGFAALPPVASPTLASTSTASMDSTASTTSAATSTSSGEGGSVFGSRFGVSSSLPPQSSGIFGTPAAQVSSQMFGSGPDHAFGHYGSVPTSSSVPPLTTSASMSAPMFVTPPPLNLPSASVKPDASASKKTKSKTKALANALVADEEEGAVVFPSRGDIEFRYRFTLTTSDRIKIWIEDRTSKQQWESNELELDEIVPQELAIPMMGLKDYFESFKSCLLAAETGLYKGANKHELIPTGDKESKDSTVFQLELTLGVQIFSKVLTPTYKFKLHAVDLNEMDILNARIRDQDEEIKELRTEIDALSSKINDVALGGRVSGSAFDNAGPVYLRAKTTDATSANHAMIWQQADGGGFLFQLFPSGAIKFSREGIYSIQIVAHHTNTYNPDHSGGFGNPWPEREAFRLEKDGRTVASSYGSTLKSSLMSSSLHHILTMQKNDELRVVYSGTGYAEKLSYIIIYMVK